MGDGGFSDTQAIHQFANSNFPIQQGGDDQNACRVAEELNRVARSDAISGVTVVLCMVVPTGTINR